MASILFHLLVFVVSGRRPIPTLVSSSAGPNAHDIRAASGGMQAIHFSVPPARPLPVPAIPVPVDFDIEPLDLDPEPDFDLAAVLGDPGLPGPPGLEGDGAGNGGTGTEGGPVYVEPKARLLTMPPTHKNLRKLTIWVFVDESGRVVADSIPSGSADQGSETQPADPQASRAVALCPGIAQRPARGGLGRAILLLERWETRPGSEPARLSPPPANFMTMQRAAKRILWVDDEIDLLRPHLLFLQQRVLPRRRHHQPATTPSPCSATTPTT